MKYVIRIQVSTKNKEFARAMRGTAPSPLYVVNDYFSDDSLLSEIVTRKFSRAFIFDTRERAETYIRNHGRRLFAVEDATILEYTDEELFIARLKEHS